MMFKNAKECWKAIQSGFRHDLLKDIERFARENISPAPIRFGTSGWRGEIGSDFTFQNARIVFKSIIATLKDNNPALKKELGIRDFEDARKRGVVVGHDNRFLADCFAKEAISMFRAEGINTYYAGETTTPEISAAIDMLKASCSINVTPSHNPSNYLGIKFNPSDGGPAGKGITNVIESWMKRIIKTNPSFDIKGLKFKDGYKCIDTTELYIKYLTQRATVDLEKIRRFFNEADVLVVIDHVHGATRSRPERLLGIDPDRCSDGRLMLLRKEDDPLFGGVAPEPSAENMKGVEEILRASNARFNIGVIMDPDGDRIRFADSIQQIPMNYFGAMALHFLYKYKGFNGIAVKSIGTSDFVNAIAVRHGIPVRETKVGFKNFRPYLLGDSTEKAIVAFEESDGISGYNNTLEKDALFGFLLAVEMVATTGKNLSEYLKELMDEYGCYYPDRSGINVDRSLTGEPLKGMLSYIIDRYEVGSRIKVGKRTLRVKDLITIDGVKMILENDSWFMIRPSGTEPKVRFYIEARRIEEKKEIFETARRVAMDALSRIT